MLNAHSHRHSKPCTCAQILDTQDCYLSICQPDKPDQIMRFDKISDAHAYGEHYAFTDITQKAKASLSKDVALIAHDDDCHDCWTSFDRRIYCCKPCTDCEHTACDSCFWTDTDGNTWCSPDIGVTNTVCDILKDIAGNNKPHTNRWLFLVTNEHKLYIGLAGQR